MLNVPAHAQVCNAIGAAAGVVSETCELTVNQPVLNVFRVHDPAGSRDFNDAQAAIEEARRLARVYVLAAAQRSGALIHMSRSRSASGARAPTPAMSILPRPLYRPVPPASPCRGAAGDPAQAAVRGR